MNSPDILESFSQSNPSASCKDFSKTMRLFLSLHKDDRIGYQLSDSVARLIVDQIHQAVQIEQYEAVACIKDFLMWIASTWKISRTSPTTNPHQGFFGPLDKLDLVSAMSFLWKKLATLNLLDKTGLVVFNDVLAIFHCLASHSEEAKSRQGVLLLIPFLDWLQQSPLEHVEPFIYTTQLVSLLLFKSPSNQSILSSDIESRLNELFSLIIECGDFQFQVELLELFWRLGKNQNFQNISNLPKKIRHSLLMLTQVSYPSLSNLAIQLNSLEKKNPKIFSALSKEVVISSAENVESTTLKDIWVHFNDSRCLMWLGDYLSMDYSEIFEWKRSSQSLTLKYSTETFTLSFDRNTFHQLMSQKFPKARFLLSSVKHVTTSVSIVLQGNSSFTEPNSKSEDEEEEVVPEREELQSLVVETLKIVKKTEASMNECEEWATLRKRKIQEVSSSLLEQSRKLKSILLSADNDFEERKKQAKMLSELKNLVQDLLEKTQK